MTTSTYGGFGDYDEFDGIRRICIQGVFDWQVVEYFFRVVSRLFRGFFRFAEALFLAVASFGLTNMNSLSRFFEILSVSHASPLFSFSSSATAVFIE